jgi:hypothetical protein
MAYHFGFIFNPLNCTCLTCGSRDFLETAIVGETLSTERLAADCMAISTNTELTCLRPEVSKRVVACHVAAALPKLESFKSNLVESIWFHYLWNLFLLLPS